ncbi:hypothetical protein [Pseudobacter ginsenosidimutans]|jgi:hypothetical protein|uniref:Uncharacterized protein n=1 Tax=Pseudobacter ginsenosidimutans TaxID=661488 RepID=A0A4Q7N3R5_9BACT|nr:hypothetical protein [Pseudobacter ginsenosidimutans]RZS75614.1 hypothetical protein EV199_1484 [Pseudobacter ginsenosidimutans]
MDIAAIPLGILIMVFYYNLVVPYFVKGIVTLSWIAKDKPQHQIGQVTTIN